MNEIDRLIEGYWRWLRDKTITKTTGAWTEITTPYLDRHNDYIQIYARKNDDKFLITDGGETILDLEQSGCSLEKSPKRQAILRTILNGFGVHENDGELQITATSDNFSLRKHNFVQALLSVQDMFMLATPTVESIFLEDIAEWLDEQDIRYTPNVKFAGKTGFDHQFDFVIPKSRKAPERILRAINNPNRGSAQNLIMGWLDTRESRHAAGHTDSVLFAFLNDETKAVSGNVIDAFENYGITPIKWSDRDAFRERLAA